MKANDFKYNNIRLLVFLLLILPFSQAGALPPAFEAAYDVKKDFIGLGTMRSSLDYDGSQYRYNKDTEAEGLAAILSGDKLIERSSGTVNNEAFQPETYFFQHKNRRKDKRDELRFVSATEVSGEHKDEAYQLEVGVGTIDRATLELVLMQDVADADKTLHYQVVERGKLKEYRFLRLGEEKIEVPAGAFLCEKIQVQRDNGEQKTTLWLAQELDYFLVKISHEEDGNTIDSVLRERRTLEEG